MDKTFIFDYDDTLAWNQHDYSYAQIEFLKFVVDRLGHRAPDVQTIINMEVEIDKKLVASYGFQMERFPQSFSETYAKICQQNGMGDYGGKRIAYRIGMLAFNEERYKKQGLVEGCAETLDFLVEQKDKLILLTKGDDRIQWKKINATGISRYFGQDNIHIVVKKDADVLKTVIGDRNKDNVFHVGNSVRSDVEPALEAGIKVIYIPCETWAYERQHNGAPKSERLFTFWKIREIKEKYSCL